jgi:hypothetical protein
MDEVNDQVQNDSPANDQVTSEQSEPTKDVVEDSNLYDLPDGRKLTGEQLKGEYQKLISDYTKKSQKLTEFEKKSAEMEARAEEAAKAAVDKSSLLEGVDPNVKELIQQISLEGFKAYMSAEQEKAAKEQKDAEWQRRFDEAEKKHDGSDGFPKFEKDAVLKFMIDKEIYDPEEAYHAFNREKREDILIKKALQDKGVASATESTGGEAPRKPSEKTPTSWEEATRSAFNRLPSNL